MTGSYRSPISVVQNWTSIPGQVGDDGTNKRVTISPLTGSRCFRLVHP